MSKNTRKPAQQKARPATIAARLVDDVVDGANDWNSDFVAGLQGSEGFLELVDAVRKQEGLKAADPGNVDAEFVAQFYLGFALGARFGGAR